MTEQNAEGERGDEYLRSKATAEHYVWGQGCDGWHLVQTDALSVIHERMPPHTAEVRHLHAEARQLFFVLSGTLTLEIDGTHHHLQTHAGAEIPPRTPHQAFNHSTQGVEFLVISQPPSRGDRVVVGDAAHNDA